MDLKSRVRWTSVERTSWKNNTRMSSSIAIWGIFNKAHLAAFPRIKKDLCRRREGPWKILGSIYYHGNTSPSKPKAIWKHTQDRKNTVQGHYSIKTYSHLWSGGWGGRYSWLTSRQFMSQLFNYLTSHSARSSILRMLSPCGHPSPMLQRRNDDGIPWMYL